jgi:hypothetical protein
MVKLLGRLETAAVDVQCRNQQFGRVFGRFRRPAQSAQRELVGPGRAAQPQINTARKQSCQRPELLGDDAEALTMCSDQNCISMRLMALIAPRRFDGGFLLSIE